MQLSRFINGKAGVSPELAIRLAKWIPAPTAIMWLRMQADHDLWQAEHSGREWRVVPARV
ncbi:HigA family addiction module antitoxin [Verticiella sediminum]|uniref:HigA family addiction module antitoxin n=1 Tax=Verticiella sediminum TaxID=1247510 RepID=UPI00338D1722